MKKSKFLFALIVLLTGIEGTLIPLSSNAQATSYYTGSAGTNWESQTISCTVTTTVTIGGGPVPGSYSQSTSYQGTMRRCYYGWGMCITASGCS